MEYNIKLKVKMIEKFRNQTEFAFNLKTHQSFVSDVIRGRVNLTLREQHLWSTALGCEPEELFLTEANEENVLVAPTISSEVCGCLGPKNILLVA